LPGDVKKRKAAAIAVTRMLDSDLAEKKLSECVIPYTDKAFCEAAIQWLISTDQVIRLFAGDVTASNIISTCLLVANMGT
jgi:hypothetical protein